MRAERAALAELNPCPAPRDPCLPLPASCLTLGQEQGVPGGNADAFHRSLRPGRATPAAGISLSSVQRGAERDCVGLLPSRCPRRDCAACRSHQPCSPRDVSRDARGAEQATPWAEPLLLSWAGLLGHRELMASEQSCRETALPRSSSLIGLGALPAGDKGRGENRERGERQRRVGGQLRAHCRRNLHQPSHGKSLAAGWCR